MNIESQLKAYVDATYESVAAKSDAPSAAVDLLDPVTATPMRQRLGRGLPMAIGSAVVVAAAIALLFVVRTDQGRTPVDAGDTSDNAHTSEPPPEPSGQVALVVNSPEIRPGNADLYLALVSHSDITVSFEPYVDLEAWANGRWETFGRSPICLGSEPCDERFRSLDEEFSYPAIGLTVDSANFRQAGRVSVQGLPSGWYRATVPSLEGPVARAILRIDEAAPQAPPPLARNQLPVNPAMVPPEGTRVVVWTAPVLRDSNAPPADQTPLSPSAETAVIEVWRNEAWIDLAEVAIARPQATVSGRPVDPSDPTRETQIPALPPGTYRLLADAASGEELEGRFWVFGAT